MFSTLRRLFVLGMVAYAYVHLSGCGDNAAAGGNGGEDEPPPAPVNCTPNEFFCDGREIHQCGADGLSASADLVKDCAGETVTTSCGMCRETGTFACISPKPSCSGSASGNAFANPATWEANGCGLQTTCTLQVISRPASTYAWFQMQVPGLEPIEWRVKDVGLVTSGVAFPLNTNDRNGNFEFTIGADKACGNPAGLMQTGGTIPVPGSVKMTFDATSSGSPLVLDIKGAITCDLRTWKTVDVHIETYWP